MKITVVNSPHVSTDRVRKIILEYGGTVTFPLLQTMTKDGILDKSTVDSFALGASTAKFAQGLKTNHDKASLLRLLERLTDVDLVPFVEKDNPEKIVPPTIQDEPLKFKESDSESKETPDPN